MDNGKTVDADKLAQLAATGIDLIGRELMARSGQPVLDCAAPNVAVKTGAVIQWGRLHVPGNNTAYLVGKLATGVTVWFRDSEQDAANRKAMRAFVFTVRRPIHAPLSHAASFRWQDPVDGGAA